MKRTVLLVDDEPNLLAVMRMILEDAGHAVLAAASAEAALAHLGQATLDVVVTDLRMPGMGGEALLEKLRSERPDVPVIVVTAHGTISSAIRAIRDGATDYLTKPFEPEQLEIAVHNALKLREVLRENARLKAAVQDALGEPRILGDSPAVRQLLDQIERVAPYRTGVLISGESGTGKELVARLLHARSPRRGAPWVAINCSAIPRDLMESELFGHVRGAFTGAAQPRVGRLEQAQGGTLFLDEIGDLDLALQAKLLRVLQEREYSPVGSDRVRSLDVRIVAATNHDLRARVRDGRFREDLLYRLDVYHIAVPPLRERGADVQVLAQAFLHELQGETGKRVRGLGPGVAEALGAHRWPGNVRELRNAVERALLSARGEWIEVGDLPHSLAVASAPGVAGAARAESRPLDDWLADLERQAILQALAECDGVQVQAARRLGISERSLWHRVKKLGLRVQRRGTGPGAEG